MSYHFGAAISSPGGSTNASSVAQKPTALERDQSLRGIVYGAQAEAIGVIEGRSLLRSVQTKR